MPRGPLQPVGFQAGGKGGRSSPPQRAGAETNLCNTLPLYGKKVPTKVAYFYPLQAGWRCKNRIITRNIKKILFYHFRPFMAQFLPSISKWPGALLDFPREAFRLDDPSGHLYSVKFSYSSLPQRVIRSRTAPDSLRRVSPRDSGIRRI
jgi:hypothetical protein